LSFGIGLAILYGMSNLTQEKPILAQDIKTGDKKMTKQTVTIRKANVDELKANIAKLNKKAVKLGCEIMVLTFDNPTTKTFDHHPVTGALLTTPLVMEYIDATLEYNIPVIEGYELIATLDIFPGENDNQVLISAVPDKVVPASHNNKNEIHCDHCGWKRNRHHSVLLQHTETGEYKEVGSTCVKDFFGHDPRGFLMMAEMDFRQVAYFKDEDSANMDRNIWAYGLKEVLSVTSAVMNKFGWLSKGKAYEFGGHATAYRVIDNLEPDQNMLKFHKDELVTVEQEDINIAVDTIKYFETLEANDNDYLLNCIKIASLGYVPYKYMGFACSMINSYKREMYKKDEAEKAAKLPASEFVGEIGQRLIDIQVNVIFTKDIESQWGLSTLYIFQDADGNVYKTFYSGSKWEYDKGDQILITGTVKKHDTYQDKKSTILNRVIAKDAPKEMFKAEEFTV